MIIGLIMLASVFVVLSIWGSTQIGLFEMLMIYIGVFLFYLFISIAICLIFKESPVDIFFNIMEAIK